jgi:HPt (histidine-containing phosphotransfer) domain-containing protein
MDKTTLLPSSEYIDINLGLKYLNGNKKLYLKILNSFLARYKNFDIYRIQKDEFKNEMHTLKGLSSTLGMEVLSNLAKDLHQEQAQELLLDFSKTLKYIISDLSTIQMKTLLIIDNNSENIDNLINQIGDSYDIMVMTNPNDDLEYLNREDINIVLLNPILSTPQIKQKLRQKTIFIIKITKPLDMNSLLLSIKNAP